MGEIFQSAGLFLNILPNWCDLSYCGDCCMFFMRAGNSPVLVMGVSFNSYPDGFDGINEIFEEVLVLSISIIW